MFSYWADLSFTTQVFACALTANQYNYETSYVRLQVEPLLIYHKKAVYSILVLKHIHTFKNTNMIAIHLTMVEPGLCIALHSTVNNM